MAVVQNMPKEIKSFWPSFRRRQLVKISVFSLLTPALYFAIVSILHQAKFDISNFVFVTLGYITTFATAYLALDYASRPLRDLLNTIAYISGEPNDKPPVNANNPDYINSGMATALDALYAGQKLDQQSQAQPDPTINLLAKALDSSKAGFVIINKDQILYANTSAPISIDTSGKKSVKLLFQPNDSLDIWLASCRANEIKADKIWTRIPSTLPEDEDCRYFDVLASYSKESECEVVLGLIDRTAIYSSSEEALNFISFAAHELRGPITIIKGYLDVLSTELKPTLDQEQIDIFERLKVSANRLSSYINNILNTSKYDRRHLRLSLAEDSVAKIYEIIRDDMNTRANTQRRLLNVSIPAGLPTIAADRASLSEVFSNLIDNAIKYSREGGTINFVAKSSGDKVEIAVEDFGIGMPANVISNLFNKFYRSHRSKEVVAGTGIGLYISKAIVESHGGQITVKSQEGKGSTFTVILPTYQTMASTLAKNQSTNAGIIAQGSGWIKNHSMYRG